MVKLEDQILVKSFVLIPGSGLDPSAGSECLNLARVSSLAASIPISSTLPPALVKNKRVTTSPPPSSFENNNNNNNKLDDNQKRIAADILPTRKRKIKNNENNIKKARIIYMSQQELMKNKDRISFINTPVGSALFLSAQPICETFRLSKMTLNDYNKKVNDYNKKRKQGDC